MKFSQLDLRLLVPLLCYVVGFAIFPPTAVTVTDEGFYVAQAAAFASGHRTLTRTDPVSGEATAEPPSPYPIGTSLLQTPLVYLGGWRAAAWLSVVALVVTVLVLGRWLRGANTSALFALMFLLYAPALVLGRVAMSDVPSACIVTVALWLFWRSRGSAPLAHFVVGLVGAVSLMFRETNVLVIAPFFLGAILRRERGWGSLLGGIAAGLAIRLGTSAWMYGDPFYLRDAGAGFAMSVVPANLLLYGVALCVLLPAGLIGTYAYRGERRAELVTSVFLTVGLFACYRYSASTASRMQQLVLAPRFLIPLAPLVVFACAESFPRLFRRVRAMISGQWHELSGIASVCIASVLAFSVHPVVATFTTAQGSMARTIYSITPDNSVIVESMSAAQKFVSPLYGERTPIDRDSFTLAMLPQIVARNAETYLVLVDRTDSEFFRADAAENSGYVALVTKRCRLTLLHDQLHDAVNRLRIWRVASC